MADKYICKKIILKQEVLKSKIVNFLCNICMYTLFTKGTCIIVTILQVTMLEYTSFYVAENKIKRKS